MNPSRVVAAGFEEQRAVEPPHAGVGGRLAAETERPHSPAAPDAGRSADGQKRGRTVSLVPLEPILTIERRMVMPTRLLISTLAMAVVVTTGVAAPQKEASVPTLSKAQWGSDLQYLAEQLPKRHKNLFHHVTREQFERAVAELDAAIPSLQDHQIIVRMLQITGAIGDAHTYVHLPKTFKVYPVIPYWFGNELRVLRNIPAYKDALGARIVKIGELSISDVQTRLLTVLSQDENEWFILSNSPGYMIHPAVLHTLGIVPDISHAVFTFEDAQGKQFSLDIVPSAPDTKPDWLSAVKEQPLSRQHPNEPFWFTYLPDSQTVYVSFRNYDSLGDNARKLFELIDKNPTRRLVIDMRQNGGGDFTKVRHSLIPGIKRRPEINKKGHLFIAIGRSTFSAAMTNAIDFRNDTSAILVGEPAGERPNSYQENDEMELPNSHLTVSYSTRYYKFLDDDGRALMPDERIDPSWDYYKAGRDPVLEWILSSSADK